MSQRTHDPRQIDPDDPRHGTNAGYKAGCREKCCQSGAAEYEYRRVIDTYINGPRTYPTQGFRRRYEALRALGWSVDFIAEAIGISVCNMPRTANGSFIYRKTHDRMCEVYERFSMTIPNDRFANRRRGIAARNGFLPPLAWDDIDTDPEPPIVLPAGVDPVAVERRMGGDMSVSLNAAERRALVREWTASGRAGAECERVTGINLWRELREMRKGEVA